MKKTLILCGSPKNNGNSAHIAKNMHTLIDSSSVLFLSDFFIKPCIDCKFCSSLPAQCAFDSEDNAKELFNYFLGVDTIIFVSPIHFYHLPSQLKAFIDRSQKFWLCENEIKKKFFAVYACARNKGDKLSQGADLTLKYFAPLIQADFIKSLCLYGLEESDDFINSDISKSLLLDFIHQNKL